MKKKAKNVKKAAKNKVKKVIKKGVNMKQISKKGLLPLGDRVLLRPLEEGEMGEKTVSGIIIPDTVSKEKPEQGEVIAVGDGRWIEGKKVPLSVKVGDKVMFSKYGYDEVKYKGAEYYILKEENILAIIN